MPTVPPDFEYIGNTPYGLSLYTHKKNGGIYVLWRDKLKQIPTIVDPQPLSKLREFIASNLGPEAVIHQEGIYSYLPKPVSNSLGGIFLSHNPIVTIPMSLISNTILAKGVRTFWSSCFPVDSSNAFYRDLSFTNVLHAVVSYLNGDCVFSPMRSIQDRDSTVPGDSFLTRWSEFFFKGIPHAAFRLAFNPITAGFLFSVVQLPSNITDIGKTPVSQDYLTQPGKMIYFNGGYLPFGIYRGPGLNFSVDFVRNSDLKTGRELNNKGIKDIRETQNAFIKDEKASLAKTEQIFTLNPVLTPLEPQTDQNGRVVQSISLKYENPSGAWCTAPLGSVEFKENFPILPTGLIVKSLTLLGTTPFPGASDLYKSYLNTTMKHNWIGKLPVFLNLTYMRLCTPSLGRLSFVSNFVESFFKPPSESPQTQSVPLRSDRLFKTSATIPIHYLNPRSTNLRIRG